MDRFVYVCLFFLFISSTSKLTTSYPLSTKSRWIVDEKGQRVKLACVNWPAHLQPTVAEGLSKQPLDSISKKIISMGCNCVRLTWPLDLMTNDTLALKVTVKQSFEILKLFEDVSGIQTHNPKILNLPLFNAFQEVVSNLGENGVMVILDNHLTTSGWCCGENDLDAFFGYPNWKDVRNATYLQKLSGIQQPFRGPGLQSKNVLFHPSSGLCVTNSPSYKLATVRLGPCPKADPCTFNPNKGILRINKMCVEAPNVAGQKVKLGVGTKCSKLGQIAATKMHFSFKTSNGLLLCLDVDERDNIVVANPCKCLTKDASCDPAIQWFKVL
ncbi:uncharacterized protein LOC17883874 [Capsella rubella]|uniref:uncharacterized protein LOC17883874 n=1 Tax=Capsella rubella TaxID=81985 RepID=UPI000CD5C8B5|nr:uncharacterized protein LOC17883874 [Capsella rubella]